MSRAKPEPHEEPLDLDRPLADLRERAGISQAEVGRRRAAARGLADPIQQGSVSDAERSGDRVAVAAMRETAEACGFELRVAVVPIVKKRS